MNHSGKHLDVAFSRERKVCTDKSNRYRIHWRTELKVQDSVLDLSLRVGAISRTT